MPDICTMIIATTMTTQACIAPVVCQDFNGRQFCTGGTAVGCKMPDPWWECRRDDGALYTLKWTEGPTFTLQQNSGQ
jgi:hypothetical protein